MDDFKRDGFLTTQNHNFIPGIIFHLYAGKEN